MNWRSIAEQYYARIAELEAEIARLTAINADLCAVNLRHAEALASLTAEQPPPVPPDRERLIARINQAVDDADGQLPLIDLAALFETLLREAAARIAELEAERDRLKAALKPLASLIKVEQFETNIVAENDLITVIVRVGDIEAARAVLSDEWSDMSRSSEYLNGRREAIKWAVTWLHLRAAEMNDGHAKSILNGAAFNMGSDAAREGMDGQPPSLARE